MVAYWRVSEVRVIEDRAVWMRFADGLEGVVRFPPEFFQGVFSPLSAPEIPKVKYQRYRSRIVLVCGWLD
jgi:hypothetical protein